MSIAGKGDNMHKVLLWVGNTIVGETSTDKQRTARVLVLAAASCAALACLMLDILTGWWFVALALWPCVTLVVALVIGWQVERRTLPIKHQYADARKGPQSLADGARAVQDADWPQWKKDIWLDQIFGQMAEPQQPSKGKGKRAK